MIAEVPRIGRHVATISRLDVLAVEQRSANIEIVSLKRPQRPIGRLPDCGRSVALIIRYFFDAVGIAERDAEKGDMCFQRGIPFRK